MHNVALVIPFGAIVLGLALAPHGAAGRLLVRLGDASYSLYILHGSFVVVLYISKWWDRVGPAEAIAARLIVITAAIGAAWLSHTYIESPLRRWLPQRLALTESAR
jgi:peptidoglycan/LPS O-acetylase OafA/YrhL